MYKRLSRARLECGHAQHEGRRPLSAWLRFVYTCNIGHVLSLAITGKQAGGSSSVRSWGRAEAGLEPDRVLAGEIAEIPRRLEITDHGVLEWNPMQLVSRAGQGSPPLLTWFPLLAGR